MVLLIKNIIKYAVLTTCGGVLSFVFFCIENAQRGCDAIGGEGLFILLPVMWWLVENIIKDIIGTFKNKNLENYIKDKK